MLIENISMLLQCWNILCCMSNDILYTQRYTMTREIDQMYIIQHNHLQLINFKKGNQQRRLLNINITYKQTNILQYL